MKFSRLCKLCLYCIIITGLLLWVLLQVNFSEVWESLCLLEYWQILILLVINIIFFFISAWRWKYFLQVYNVDISLKDITGHQLAGFAVSYFSPGPQFGGEPLQIYLLQKYHNTSLEISSVSVFLDRLVNMSVNFGVLILGILWIFSENTIENIYLSWFSMVMPLLGLVFIVAVFLCYKFEYTLFTNCAKLLHLSPTVVNYIDSSEKKVIALSKSPSIFIAPYTCSFVLWIITFVEFWLVFYFLGCSLSFAQLLTLLMANRIALLMPTPGGIGAIEASLFFVLQILGLPISVGLASIVLVRLRDIFFATLGIMWLFFILKKIRISTKKDNLT